MKHILFLITLFLCSACSDISQGNKTSSIPELLQRSTALQQGTEWDKVQNQYAAYRKEITADPSNVKARLSLAELFINEARVTGEHPHYYPAALSLAKEVIALSEKDTESKFHALSIQASVQLSLHDFANALVTAKEAIALNPYNAKIYGALVDAHVELGQYKEAVEAADKMVSIRPDLRSYSRVSYLREIHGDIPGAIEAMDMAVKAGGPGQEQTAWSRCVLAHLYRIAGDTPKASMQYQLALDERPDYPFAIEGLAEIAMSEKKYDEAEKLLNKACAIIPEVSFHEKLAELYKIQKRDKEFEAKASEILTMFQEDEAKGHNMSLEKARFYLEIQPDLQKAKDIAQVEWQRRPDNIDVNRLMARITLMQGDKEKAKDYTMRAGTTGSRHPELLEMKHSLHM